MTQLQGRRHQLTGLAPLTSGQLAEITPPITGARQCILSNEFGIPISSCWGTLRIRSIKLANERASERQRKVHLERVAKGVFWGPMKLALPKSVVRDASAAARFNFRLFVSANEAISRTLPRGGFEEFHWDGSNSRELAANETDREISFSCHQVS